jgi:carbonic anhydrase
MLLTLKSLLVLIQFFSTEIVSWFVIDKPLTISKRQLEQMKKILFTNVDRNTCKSTAVHHANSVARPIQESGGRQVWRCTRENFIPDHERQN